MWLIRLLRALTGLQFAQDESSGGGQPPPLANQEDKTEIIPEAPAQTEIIIGQPTSQPESQPQHVGEDRQGRFLFVDVYPGDIGGKPNWHAFDKVQPVAGFDCIGGVIKCSEGYAWGMNNEAWFRKNWQELKAAHPTRYGNDWLRGCYCFLLLTKDGKKQAEYYLRQVELAGGGWDDGGTMMPIVDVELGNETHPNQKASAQQIIDCTSAWADTVRTATGRRIMLYGNGAMRDKGIKSRMSCDMLWIPRYTPTLPADIYLREGWDADHVCAWQYGGDGTAFLSGYPKSIPGFGAVDISVCIDGAKPVTLASAIKRLT